MDIFDPLFPEDLISRDASNNPKLNIATVLDIYEPKVIHDPRTDKLFIHNGLYYTQTTCAVLEHHVFDVVRKFGINLLSPSQISLFEKNIKLRRTITNTKPPKPTSISFLDCIYDIKSGEIDEHTSPDIFYREGIMIDFKSVKMFMDNPELEPPEAKYLKQLMVTPEVFDMLMECVGCFLFDKRRRFAPILYVYGKGGSGKTHIGNILKGILGERLSPDGIPKKYSSGFNMNFAYKDLIVVDEVAGGVLSDYAMDELKRLTSAADYLVTPKGKESFKIPAKEKPMVLMTSNKPPAFSYDSGIERRMRIIRAASLQIIDPTYRGWEERDFKAWFIHQAILGYRRVLANNGISKTDLTKEIMRESDESHLVMHLAQRFPDHDSQRAYLMGMMVEQPPTPNELTKEVRDFETDMLGMEKAFYDRSKRVADLDMHYELAWDKHKGIYVERSGCRSNQA